MKNYLSFGGGVNSVAMMLLLMDEGMEFGSGRDCEAVYVWMPDWPETHDYLMMLEERGYPITVIFPSETCKGEKLSNLYEYAWKLKMFPRRFPRWCTTKFKIKPLHNYFQKPCFVFLGIDAGESHRAKLSINKGMENRFPLLERELNRADCIEVIKAHGLPIPQKSGCFICPFQGVSQLKKMRRNHPDMFCRLVALEERNISQLRKGDYYTRGKPFREIVNEPDAYLFDDMAYPPCQCGL